MGRLLQNELHAADVFDANRSAVRVVFDHRFPQRFERLVLAQHAEADVLPSGNEIARRFVDVVATERGAQLGDADLPLGQLDGIEPDLDLVLAAAVDADFGNAADAFQGRFHVAVGVVVEGRDLIVRVLRLQ